MLSNPKLTHEEAMYFLLGFKNKLFVIDNNGYVQSSLLPEKQKHKNEQRMLCLFWRRGSKWTVFREGICQLAEVSKLVYKFGWDANEIMMEPKNNEFKNIAYGIDILASAKSSNMKFCIEVKKDDLEYRKLEAAFEFCCSNGPHQKEACMFPKNHAKYEFCMNIKPEYFAMVSPNLQSAYKLTYFDDYLTTQKIPYDPKKCDLLFS